MTSSQNNKFSNVNFAVLTASASLLWYGSNVVVHVRTTTIDVPLWYAYVRTAVWHDLATVSTAQLRMRGSMALFLKEPSAAIVAT
jgi:hypothetical protein